MVKMWIYCKQCKLDFEAVAEDIYNDNLIECPQCHAEIELDEHQVAILNIK